MSRVGVIAPQGTEPYRYVPKTVAATLLRKRLCEPVRIGHRNSKKLIRELPGKKATSNDIDRFLRSKPTVIPHIKPPRKPEPLLLQYPLKDDSSYYRENRRRVWGLKKPKKGEKNAN